MNASAEPTTTKRRRQPKGTHKFHINLTADQEARLIQMADEGGESYSLLVGRLVDAEYNQRRVNQPSSIPK